MLADTLEQQVEGTARARSGGRRIAPFFSGILQDLQEELESITRFLVEQINASDNQKDVSLRGKPGQVRYAFVERVPVLSEITRELQGRGEFVEERGRGL